MTGLMLAETAPARASVLVLGAGGGLELRALARMQPRWRFTGVDPSAQMLDLARQTLGEDASRADLLEGYIDAAPPGPFDAGVCLLTLHFLDAAERLRTLGEIARRLKPGAPLVIAHHSFPHEGAEGDRWLRRHAAFSALAEGGRAPKPVNSGAMRQHLPVLSPREEEALMQKAGFENAELFYAGLTFKGWVCRRQQ